MSTPAIISIIGGAATLTFVVLEAIRIMAGMGIAASIAAFITVIGAFALCGKPSA